MIEESIPLFGNYSDDNNYVAINFLANSLHETWLVADLEYSDIGNEKSTLMKKALMQLKAPYSVIGDKVNGVSVLDPSSVSKAVAAYNS